LEAERFKSIAKFDKKLKKEVKRAKKAERKGKSFARMDDSCNMTCFEDCFNKNPDWNASQVMDICVYEECDCFTQERKHKKNK